VIKYKECNCKEKQAKAAHRLLCLDVLINKISLSDSIKQWIYTMPVSFTVINFTKQCGSIVCIQFVVLVGDGINCIFLWFIYLQLAISVKLKELILLFVITAMLASCLLILWSVGVHPMHFVGFFTVNETTNSNMYFWFFPAKVSNSFLWNCIMWLTEWKLVIFLL